MNIRYFFPFAFLFLASCHTTYHPVSVAFKDYKVEQPSAPDTLYGNYLKPFRDSMELKMNEVVGTAAKRMDIKRPLTTVGNFMSDAFLEMARLKFDQGADISVMNLGGIRKPYIEPGPITRGIIFEVMPFDNVMTLVTVKGEQLQKFLDASMTEGGGVAGCTFRISGKQATDVMIGGKPLDPSAEYTLVTSDYAANNPSMSWFYGPAKKQQQTYLLRDAILDYVVQMGREGKPIGEQLENRIQIDK
jgi:2',3'-cyclic-nucleotide 2'-phosphodiesterase (5'-nucleotidase family)